jgi:hypothetical protein
MGILSKITKNNRPVNNAMITNPMNNLIRLLTPVARDTVRNIKNIRNSPDFITGLNKAAKLGVNGMVRTGAALNGTNPFQPIDKIEKEIATPAYSKRAVQNAALGSLMTTPGEPSVSDEPVPKANPIIDEPMPPVKEPIEGIPTKSFKYGDELDFDAMGHRMREGYRPTDDEMRSVMEEAGRRVSTMPIYRPAQPLYEEALNSNDPEHMHTFIREMFGGG